MRTISHSTLRRFHVAFAALLLLAFITSTHASDTIYVVQQNDTLSEIAVRHKVAVASLAVHNQIDHPDRIFVGQKLRIPGENPVLPPQLQAQLSEVAVNKTKWRYIVIHHSASSQGNVASFDRYHRQERRMENGLAYHFLIGNGLGMGDGEIALGNRWREQLDGGHLASFNLNKKSIGICLVGNFEKTKPTPKQMESLHALTHYLLNQCQVDVSAVQTHQEINTIHTKCPGRMFPEKEFLQALRNR